MRRVRMSLMFYVSKKEEGTNDKEAPFKALRKINAMFKELINKIPGIKTGPWLTFASPKKSDLRTEVDEDVDMAELYVCKYNRFVSPGDRR